MNLEYYNQIKEELKHFCGDDDIQHSETAEWLLNLPDDELNDLAWYGNTLVLLHPEVDIRADNLGGILLLRLALHLDEDLERIPREWVLYRYPWYKEKLGRKRKITFEILEDILDSKTQD